MLSLKKNSPLLLSLFSTTKAHLTTNTFTTAFTKAQHSQTSAVGRFSRAAGTVILLSSLVACGFDFDDVSQSNSTADASPTAVEQISEAASPAENVNTSDPQTDASFDATVSWDIPTERENGEALPLSEIGGYEIAFRKTDSEQFDVLIVDDHTAQSLVIENLAAGEYEFKIASFDSNGMYGQYSQQIYAKIGS